MMASITNYHAGGSAESLLSLPGIRRTLPFALQAYQNHRQGQPTALYTVEQMRFLVHHIGDIQDPADRAHLAIRALHPLRLEEVLGLQRTDIGLEHRAIHICRAVTHPTRSQHEVKVTRTRSRARATGLCPIRRSERCAAVSGEGDTRFTENITPIHFRTTVLTDLYVHTKDIKPAQLPAGHTSSAITLRYYDKGRETISKATAVVDQSYSS